MAGPSAIRNRSEIVTVTTPRGAVDVVRQEMRVITCLAGLTGADVDVRRAKAGCQTCQLPGPVKLADCHVSYCDHPYAQAHAHWELDAGEALI
jgi:hypothetical protein